MACMQHEDPNDSVSCKRRAILFMGISVLPHLKLRARAVDSLAPENSEIRTQEQSEKAKGNASPNPFLSLLNGVGIFSSGLLGALYALVQKDKATAEATIESMKTKLKEKEAAIVSLQKNFESELLNEKEQGNKQLKKVNEERQSLMNQLQLANTTITGLGQELQKQQRLIEGFKVQIDSLTTNITKAGEDKKKLEEELREKLESIEVLQERINLLCLEIKDKDDNLRDLSSTLAVKEMEINNLSSTYEQTQDEIAGLKSDIGGLKDKLLKTEKVLELKNVAVDDLNAHVRSLIAERDDSNRKLDAINMEYSDWKLTSGKKAASDAKLLEDGEHKLHQLKEQLDLALDEVSRNKVLVADLTQERDDLRKVLDVELKNVKNLEKELQINQEIIKKSKNEASNLTKELHQSRNLCSELEAEISSIQAEFAEARELFQKNLVEAKQNAEVLAGERTSAKEALKKMEEELQIVLRELAAAAETRDSLQKELVDVYKKAESAANELKEEKKIGTHLKKELKALETQMLKDKEARKSLESDLEDATKSLDEMNRNALILSRDQELANSQISSLEDEKEVLYKSLADQKQLSQAAQENIEDAHSLVMRLGKERESLEKRAKKLEEELASAKGEILRVKSKINSSSAPVNDQHQEKGVKEGKATGPVKKTRRRKVVSQQEKS